MYASSVFDNVVASAHLAILVIPGLPSAARRPLPNKETWVDGNCGQLHIPYLEGPSDCTGGKLLLPFLPC